MRSTPTRRRRTRVVCPVMPAGFAAAYPYYQGLGGCGQEYMARRNPEKNYTCPGCGVSCR